MKTPFSSNSLPEATRRRVDMAVAVAQEHLLSTHVRHALGFVELVADRVPIDDVLDIYGRLLRLSSEEAGVVTTRTLATLGQRADSRDRTSKPRPESEAEAASAGDSDGHSLFSRLRQRLRGRIDEQLRFLIELEAARAEEALLYTHVENALNFVDLLDDELPVPEAVDLYLDALDVRESNSEVVYNLSLAQISDHYLPDDAAAERKTEPDIVLSDRDAAERAGEQPVRRRRAG